MKKGIVAFLIAVMCLFAGCAPAEKSETLTVFCMDTVMEIRVFGENCTETARAVAAMLQELDNTWSYTNEDSVIYRLNNHKENPNAENQKILDFAMALSERTGGALDPRLGDVSEVWGFRSERQRVPTREEIENALAQRKWDMGALIKGYAGQQAAQLLLSENITCAILNLGGNVQTVGSKSSGEPWLVGIQNPSGGEPLGIISVEGTASVVTSGDYQRYFEQDGVRYHHIMDPQTGMPSRSGLSSVTVICRDGMTADGLSTALFVMGLEQGNALWQESDDFEAVFVLSDGRMYATEGAALSGCEYEVIHREK